MKTYLVTYYFTNGEVHAVRYTNDYLSKEMFIDDIFKKSNDKSANFIIYEGDNDYINLNQVCRFTIDELEGDEK